MTEYNVQGWASVPLSTIAESDDGHPDREKAVEVLADEIEQMDEEELRARLKADIEHTHTEEVL